MVTVVPHSGAKIVVVFLLFREQTCRVDVW